MYVCKVTTKCVQINNKHEDKKIRLLNMCIFYH